MRLVPGFAASDRGRVAQLYWQAFGGKLGRVMGPEPMALAYLNRVLQPDHAISALDDAGQLIGVVGFQTWRGQLVAGSMADMAAIYGTFGAAWRSLMFWSLSQRVPADRFIIDGIFVSQQARGQGVGTALLDAAGREALRLGYREMRLEVVDTNTRAQALYERRGFRAIETQPTGPLRHVFGFAAATTMVRQLGR
jgi:ribosomal protein S18 acetylase RimI-like enzyme